MSYNGSGTFNINSTGQPVVAGTVITASAFNALTTDLATGLTTAITKDGQTTTTARITFAQGITSSLVTDSSSVSTGSIITAGGAGIAKNLYVGVNANVAGTLGVTGVATFSAAPIYSSLTASSAVATDASKGLVSVTNTGTGNNVLATAPTIASLNLTTALTIASASGTVGQVLTSGGSGGAPTWSSPSTTSISNGTSNVTVNSSGGTITAATNGTTAVTIDTSQNVGIGTSSPSVKLHVSGGQSYVTGQSSAGAYSRWYNNAQTTGDFQVGQGWLSASDNIGVLCNNANAAVILGTNGSERMRITSDNYVLVGRTSAFTSNSADNTTGFGIFGSDGQTLVNATGSINALIVNNTNTNNRLVSFRSANTEVGGVTITASTAAFNGTSDSRLKEDLGVSTDTSVIDNTIIHNFKWTRDGTQGKGVFAQEAYEVYPLAVSKGSDELNESGNLSNPWQVNYSQYIPDLIVYCQQLKKTVDTQAELISGQAETINALTARIVALENA